MDEAEPPCDPTVPDAAPRRVRLSRARGWRLPPNTVTVARPTAWGNPYRVGDRVDDPVDGSRTIATRADAVRLFTERVVLPPPGRSFEDLRGRNLACWCPLDGPCHADVLLERANRAKDRQST